ncbi:MAG: hypothetical protein DWQ04_17070 [Chloroflexi bacterium]|nr:MAG: hypothetical protein DWQ04_17070 [Chloroflexota bacterium]
MTGQNSWFFYYLINYLTSIKQRPFRSAPPALLDLTSCAQGKCEITPIDGIPLWSPDSQRTLLNDTTSMPDVDVPHGFLLGNAKGETITQISQTSVGTPFWFDVDQYGYLRWQHDFESLENTVILNPTELVVSSIDTNEPKILLKTEDLWPLQPDENFPLSHYEWAAAIPDNPDQILIMAVAYDPEALQPSGPGLTADSFRNQLWLFNQSSGELTLQFQPLILADNPRFSPDGRWLLVWQFVVEEQNDLTTLPKVQYALHLFDLHNNWQQMTIDEFLDLSDLGQSHSEAWSADGQWLFIANNDQLYAIAPAENQHVTFPLAADGCHQVVSQWENES